jgi:hypothetical protein
MNRGGKASLLISYMAMCGCTAAAPDVKVRAIANPSADISRSGDAVAVARGQLLLGNVGLALEAFRKAQRDDPADPAVLAGIGDCYSAMSRFDLAQTNYEAALALAPHDRKLLLGLAAIYEREGKSARAMVVRAEADTALQAATAAGSAVAQAGPAAPKRVEMAAAARVASPPTPVAIPKPSIGSITVELPEARPAPHLDSHAPRPSAPDLDLAPVAPVAVASAPLATQDLQSVTLVALNSITVDLPAPAPAGRLETHDVPRAPELLFADAEPAAVAPAPLPAPADRPVSKPVFGSVAVELPARPAESLEARGVPQPVQQIVQIAEALPSTVPVPVSPAAPVPAPLPPREDRRDVAVALAPAPRLERLSRGEVALVTTGKPLWKTPGNVQMASATGVRWVALEGSRDRPNVRILNAARSQGLAASARTVLFDRGWRKIAVGDAPDALRKSVVLYPKGREQLGRRLARQFGVSAQMAERDDVVLILGRDSIRRIGG